MNIAIDFSRTKIKSFCRTTKKWSISSEEVRMIIKKRWKLWRKSWLWWGRRPLRGKGCSASSINLSNLSRLQVKVLWTAECSPPEAWHLFISFNKIRIPNPQYRSPASKSLRSSLFWVDRPNTDLYDCL